MKFLIAGLGSIGRRHLRNLLSLGERDLVLYRTRRSTLPYAEPDTEPDAELDGFPVEMDLHAALEHRPDAVIVSNPTSLHLDIAIPAAEAGCHILLEKPISHSLDRVDEFQAAVCSGGGQVLVGFQFRFHPGLQKIADLLAKGAIGRPLSVRAHWGEYLPNWHPWEDYRISYSARSDLGGGVILTLSHPLDYLPWLLGDVHRLWAFAGRLGDLELTVEDTAEIGLEFESSALGSVHLDYNQQPSVHVIEVIGSQGTIRWDHADGAVRLYQASTPLQGEVRDRGESWELFPAPPNFERNAMFLAEMRHFLAVVRGEASPACTLDDGIKALRLALAASQSAQTGHKINLVG